MRVTGWVTRISQNNHNTYFLIITLKQLGWQRSMTCGVWTGRYECHQWDKGVQGSIGLTIHQKNKQILTNKGKFTNAVFNLIICSGYVQFSRAEEVQE